MACVMQEARTDDLMVPPGPKKYLQIMIIDDIYALHKVKVINVLHAIL